VPLIWVKFMINLNNLERRIAALEKPLSQSIIDPLVEVLGGLMDDELICLDEYLSLQSAGFSEEAIRDMVGEESYQQNLAICAKIEEEMRLKETVSRHQHVPEPKLAEKLDAPRKKRGRPLRDEAACQA
jgi:hypothetical protein